MELHTHHTYNSLQEFVDACMEKHNDGSKHWDEGVRPEKKSDWTYNADLWDAANLAKYGWSEGLQKAEPIVESALDLVEQHDLQTNDFKAFYDVAGAEVDVGAFCEGEPECMIDYEMIHTSKVGRVVTLCASVTYSASFTAEQLIARGSFFTALALALEKTGHPTELWVDFYTAEHFRSDDDRKEVRTRVKVKGANDHVDPSQIAFAYGHPAMLRRLLFMDWKDLPKRFRFGGFGTPLDPIEDLPEGTIYLPARITGQTSTGEDVLEKLRELGLVND